MLYVCIVRSINFYCTQGVKILVDCEIYGGVCGVDKETGSGVREMLRERDPSSFSIFEFKVSWERKIS